MLQYFNCNIIHNLLPFKIIIYNNEKRYGSCTKHSLRQQKVKMTSYSCQKNYYLLFLPTTEFNFRRLGIRTFNFYIALKRFLFIGIFGDIVANR